MTQKTALITGIIGQDGAYLAELLLSKGYIVHGVKRRASCFNTQRIEHRGIGDMRATMSRVCGGSRQQDEPDHHVLATGEAHSVREFVERAFTNIGIEIAWEGADLMEVGIDRRSGRVLVGVDPGIFGGRRLIPSYLMVRKRAWLAS